MADEFDIEIANDIKFDRGDVDRHATLFSARASARLKRNANSTSATDDQCARSDLSSDNDLDSLATTSSARSRSPADRKENDLETDAEVLSRREKQLTYGKNTTDYEKYASAVSKHMREQGMPCTPDKSKKYSRRQWDGLVRNWKLRMHKAVRDIENDSPNATIAAATSPSAASQSDVDCISSDCGSDYSINDVRSGLPSNSRSSRQTFSNRT